MYVFDEFELDPEAGDLRHRGELVKAEATVTRLLLCLLRRGEGVLVTKDELIEEVWDGRAIADNAITVCVARLRKLLREHGGAQDYITTAYAKGYRFMRSVTRIEKSAPRGPRLLTGAWQPDSMPCVGRERVLTRLRRLHDMAARHAGSACVVMGEAGIGKTRVVESFARDLDDGARVVWAYCRESGAAPPLAPWLRLLRSAAADVWTPELAQALGPHAERVAAWLGSDPEGAGFVCARVDKADRYATYDAILQTLALVARKQPLCLVLDDLHRADSASLELLDMALDEIAQTRILLLCTMRKLPDSQLRRAPSHLAAILGHRNCERIRLDPLTRSDVAEYLRARLPDVAALRADQVFEHSEGVPFFMVELVRQLEAAPEGGPSAGLTVPGASLELFRGRVARLSAPAQEVVRCAAVIGRAFEMSLLEAVCTQSAADTVAGIDEAIADDIVVAAPGSSSAFAFGHELMRRAIYDSLPGAERRALHLRVAEMVEQRGRVDDTATHEIAFHLHAALPEGDPTRAARFCEKAAHMAGAAFANVDAVQHLRHAIEALDLQPAPGAHDRARLHMVKAMYSRGQPGYRESLESAFRIASELGDGRMLAVVACMHNPHPVLQPLPGVRPVLQRAKATLQVKDDGVRGALLAVGAIHPPECFDRTTVEARLTEAEELVDRATEPYPLYPLLLARLHLTGGVAREVRAALRAELTELARREPYFMRVLPIDVALDLAIDSAQHGLSYDTETALRRAALLARGINHRELLWHVERMQAWWEIDHGDAQRGVSELTRLHRRAERSESLRVELYCAFDRCMLLPEDARAAQHLEDADLWALRYEPCDPVHIWAMKVRALTAAGLMQEARESLHEVSPARLKDLPLDGQLVGSLAQIGRAALALDERDHVAEVAALLPRLSAPYAINVGFRSEGAVAVVLGELLAYLQQHEDARSQLEEGLALNERVGLSRCAEQARAALSRLPAA